MFVNSPIFRIFLALSIAGMVGLMIWFVVSKKTEAPAAIVANALMEGEEMAIQWAQLLEKKDNKITLRIKSEKAVISEDRKRINLTNFSMVSYGEGSGRTTIIARDGLLDNDTKDVTANGGVLVMDGEGRAMYTEKLYWYEGKKTLSSDSLVKIFGGNFVIKGSALEVDTMAGMARISGGVTAIFSGRK
ncbi:MAG: LPS export ABC transporter periplasmic protein LptC [Nitrospinota bacterium]|nr:LPS export ABC transporter periplasmic protein LptC [Nitrospinota bacterium]MDH5755061.1 LPS export ABC transporter periplasmic protein LptC [Nitrospinota bacterium]